MIKVNLLRNVAIANVASDPDVAGTQKQAAIRIAVILACPLVLLGYEKLRLSDLQSNLQGVRKAIAEIESAKSKLGEAGPRIEKYTKEKSKIEKEMDQLRLISRNRLREVKTLDAIQTVIPDRTWLQSLSIEGPSVRMAGLTTSEAGLSTLLRRLEESPLFSQVEPRATTQVTIGDKIEAKRFELDFKIGKQQE